MEDEDMMYQPGYEGLSFHPHSYQVIAFHPHSYQVIDHSLLPDDEPGIPDPPWEWDLEEEDGMVLPRGHHHHHHPRRTTSPWTIFPPGGSGDRSITAYTTFLASC